MELDTLGMGGGGGGGGWVVETFKIKYFTVHSFLLPNCFTTLPTAGKNWTAPHFIPDQLFNSWILPNRLNLRWIKEWICIARDQSVYGL